MEKKRDRTSALIASLTLVLGLLLSSCGYYGRGYYGYDNYGHRHGGDRVVIVGNQGRGVGHGYGNLKKYKKNKKRKVVIIRDKDRGRRNYGRYDR